MPRTATVALLCHPMTPCPALSHLSVTATLAADGSIALDYRLVGNLQELLIPAQLQNSDCTAPVDGLWQHTCCEAFVARPGSPAYHEFNFSPSGQWANYAFNDYRQHNDLLLPPLAAPTISQDETGLNLRAILPPATLPVPPDSHADLPATLQIGLTAVIETGAGKRSYWALAHPPGQPDFHQRRTFSLLLGD